MSFTPYQKKGAGDVLKLQDWLAVQARIKEELREHRHLGKNSDGEVAPAGIGPTLTGESFAPGAVRAGKLAPGAVEQRAIAAGAIEGRHLSLEERIPERLFRFRTNDGHNHDGVGSRALPSACVSSDQLQDGVVTVSHLAGTPEGVKVTPAEESYASGRAFTPGNTVRALRELLSHTKLDKNPVLFPGSYLAMQGRLLAVDGIRLVQALDTAKGEQAGEYMFMEFFIPATQAHSRMSAQVVSNSQVVAEVPELGPGQGAQGRSGWLRLVRGNGTIADPFVPATNAVRFTYEPAQPGTPMRLSLYREGSR